jgi:hypothetical protein
VEFISDLIISKLKTMDELGQDVVLKRKAINTLLPYAIFLEQDGQRGMIDAILHAARVSDSNSPNIGKFMWHHVTLYTSRLFEKRSPTSLNRVITLISPYVSWNGALNNKIAVARWAAAASEIPYSEEVGQSVVIALFQIAMIDFLRPHIPIEMWGWMKRQPTLPYIYNGVLRAADVIICSHVRRLGDIDILKSYFLLVWDQRACHPRNLLEMETSIREDFGGMGMGHHRKDLIQQLDPVIGRLNSRAETPSMRRTKLQYTRLKDLLLEVDRR